MFPLHNIFALVIRWIDSECKPIPDGYRANKDEPYTSTGKPQPLIIKKMKEDMKQVADLITANIINTTKEVLTSDEAAKYMGISKSYLYKLTMLRRVPHFKPTGKMCYFNRHELENWLQSNRIATDEAIASEAQSYCMKGGKK